MTTILIEQQDLTVTPASEAPGLWLSAADLERVTGFTLKPEGLCKYAICVPVPCGDKSFVTDGLVDTAAFWRHIGNPIVHDEPNDVWSLGIGAGTRTQTLETLEAPNFSLPDIDGRVHSLSDQRGKKVFLATWASW
jgi:hypothetical protein